MSRVTLKSSTIFISVGDETRVYRSVEDVPPGLRKRLEQSTNGINSATILIADRRGRQEIARAIRGLPSNLRNTPLSEQTASLAPSDSPGSAFLIFLIRHWAEILLPPALGFAVWALCRFHV